MAFMTADRKKSLYGALSGVGAGLFLFMVLLAAVGQPTQDTALAAVLLIPGLIVFILTLGVAGGRFFTQAFDPLKKGQETRYLQITLRALGNSAEQGLAFATMGSALVLAGDAWANGFAMALALTFGVARLAFWFGYLRTMFGRAPGMAATMVINLVTAILAVAAILV
jgi:hypothetical protein